MNRSFPHVLRRAMPLPALLFASSLLGGCGGSPEGDSGSAPDGSVFADQEGIRGEGESMPGGPEGDAPVVDTPVPLPAPLLVLTADPERAARVPAIVDVETLADSGLQIAYTERSQRVRIEPLRVGVQWQYMQSCINVVAPPPLVLIRTEVEPFADTDDVIRDIEGRVAASASEFFDGMAILQVRDAPFDGSRADAGFGLLRQIMGRHLWLSEGLLERFYPSRCAREVPPEPATP